MCTALANESGVAVGTVEHLMSALAGLAIDNLVVEVDGPEVPIMDGSAGPFVFLMECAGAREQPRPRRAIRVLAPVTVAGDKWRASLVPADGFSVSMDIAFDTPAVAAQSFGVRLVNGTFKKELASARTFGFLRDVQKLWAAGLARGGSLENAVVVHDDRILNEEGLRYKDEFVRHKILDAVGDLYLAGAPLLASFRGVCSGHSANNRLLQALFAREDAWTWDVMRVRQGPPAEEAVLDADVDRPAPLRAAAG
jgi:UDP-3-O-[3-hydroxymyristoyl] N-acetylglucosamine deacetylase